MNISQKFESRESLIYIEFIRSLFIKRNNPSNTNSKQQINSCFFIGTHGSIVIITTADSPALHGLNPTKKIDKSLITNLARSSASRVAKEEKFLDIIKQNRQARDKKGIVRLTDLRNEAKTKIPENDKENKMPKNSSKKVREQYQPFINESVNILMDMVTLSSAAITVDVSGRNATFASGR